MVFIIKMKQEPAQKGHLNNKNKEHPQHYDFVARLVKKRALVKSQQKAPAPEWEDVRAQVEAEGFGEIHTHARAGRSSAASQGEAKGWLSTKRTHKGYGQLCSAYGSIRNSNAKEEIYLRGKPSNCISQKVKLVKRETAPSSESAHSVCWLGEAKTA